MSELRVPINEKDHFQGDLHAPIQLVEYGDYQCPYCGQAYGIVKNIQEKLGKNLLFVFRNFPLTEMHPHALTAAVASEVAAKHGKFWEMHDALYENQKNLSDSNIIQLAEEIGIDTEEFEKDFQNEEFVNKVQADFESGVRSGVNGTPSFYVNGKKYEDSWDYDSFISNLESLL